MKKISIVIIVFLIVLSGAKMEKNFSLLNYFSGEYTAYISNNVDGAINLGFCYMNSKPTSEKVLGESMVIENFEISSALEILNARVVKTEYLDDGTIVIYAFSNLIDETKEVFGQKVNLQIATRNERSVVGWPLIFGSF